MSVTDWKFPQLVTNEGTSYPWVNKDYVKADDSNYSSCNVPDATKGSDTLLVQNFGFTYSDIPSDATIDGIELQDAIYCSGTTGFDGLVGIFLENNVRLDKASAVNYLTSREVRTYGGATDKWMGPVTPTPQNICVSTFGFRYRGTGSGNLTFYIDYFKVRIYFSGGTTTSVKDGNIRILTPDGLMKTQAVNVLTDAGWKKTNQFLFC